VPAALALATVLIAKTAAIAARLAQLGAVELAGRREGAFDKGAALACRSRCCGATRVETAARLGR